MNSENSNINDDHIKLIYEEVIAVWIYQALVSTPHGRI